MHGYLITNTVNGACEPAGPLAILVNTAFPVTRWVVGVSLNPSVLVFSAIANNRHSLRYADRPGIRSSLTPSPFLDREAKR